MIDANAAIMIESKNGTLHLHYLYIIYVVHILYNLNFKDIDKYVVNQYVT